MAAKAFILIFLFYLLYIIQTESTNIECSYDDNTYNYINSVYECEVQNHLNIDSPNITQIRSANGKHNSGMDDADVKVFYAFHKNIQYFPAGLDNIFPNLKMIGIYYGRLKEIHQSDLQPFPNLIRLDLEANDIEILEKDLFKYNSELRYINFRSNIIYHIDFDVFNQFESLNVFLLVDYNNCINMHAYNDTNALEEVIKYAKNRCQSKEYLNVERDLKNFEDKRLCRSFKNLKNLDMYIVQLRDKISRSKFRNYFQARLANLEANRDC